MGILRTFFLAIFTLSCVPPGGAPLLEEDFGGAGFVNVAPVAEADTLNAVKGVTTNSFNPLTNDNDANGDQLTISAVTQPTNGTIVNNGDGTLKFTPNAGFSGNDSFTYTITDPGGLSDQATVSVTVTNTAPVANNDSDVTGDNFGVTINVVGNDTDANGDTLSINATTNGTNGTVVDNGNGTVTYTPNVAFIGNDSFTYTITDGDGGSDTGTVSVTVVAAFTWLGKGGNTNWNTTANWSTGVQPGAANTALFDGNCTQCNATVNVDPNVQGVIIGSGYTGTITQSAGVSFTVGNLGWNQAAGTFTGGNSAMAIGKEFIMTGGNFSSTSGILTLTPLNASSTILSFSAGTTFSHNNGSVVFSKLSNSFSTYDINVDSTLTFFNLRLTGGNSCCNNNRIWQIAAGDRLIVENDFQMGSNSSGPSATTQANGGTIEVRGNITLDKEARGGTTVLELTGTANQTYTLSAGGDIKDCLPILRVNKTGGSVTAAGGTTLLCIASLELVQGSFSAPTGTLRISPTPNSAQTVLTEAAGTTFNHSNGTVLFEKLANSFINNTINVTSNLEFFNITFGGGHSCCSSQKTWTIAAGDSITAKGNVTIGRTQGTTTTVRLNGGTLFIEGNLSVDPGTIKGTTAITFSGTGAQTFNNTGGTNFGSLFTINKAAGTLTLLANMDLTDAGQNMNVTSGTLELDSFNLNMTAGGTLTVGGGADVLCSGGGSITNTPTLVGAITCPNI